MEERMFDDPRDNDTRDRNDDMRERELDWDSRERTDDPRDVFLRELNLPREHEREFVLERSHAYRLNGNDSRTLATVGVFRVVSERELSKHQVDHLRGEGLVQKVWLTPRERGVVLTGQGRNVLESHRRDPDVPRRQEFHAGIGRARELTHDAQLHRAYLRAEERLRERGAEVRRVVLEVELKREYQRFLQERNRGNPNSDGRPTRDRSEIERWAHDHDLPQADGHVRFPDLRIEYEQRGEEHHEDVEVVTPHYRGGHASSCGGFSCCGGGNNSGSTPFDPRFAERDRR
jgi:hypothetical protein